MAQNSKIEWTEATWNPVTGCTPISEGCENCYAKAMIKRFGKKWGYDFTPQFHPDRLEEPLKWKKPRQIFVCSMGDLFHPNIPFEHITEIFDVMCSWVWPNKAAEREGDESALIDPGHTYIVLTKRPERVKEWYHWVPEYWPGDTPLQVALESLNNPGQLPSHIWLGVTAENQRTWNERVPILMQIPSATRFVSIEPMLSRIDIDDLPEVGDPEVYPLDWIIVGGETGPGARLMQLDWAREIRDNCKEVGVPFFFKQVGSAITQHKNDKYLLDDVEHNEYPNTNS